MADSLFGPSPAEILYSRQKDLADRQSAEYNAYLGSASSPAERTAIMAGRTLTQGIGAPLLGLGASQQDPMLQQAASTQSILSRYGPNALTNPDILDQMAAEFSGMQMNNEAFQLAERAAKIRKDTKPADRYISSSGEDLMLKFPEIFSGLDPFASYQVNTETNEVKDLGSGLTIGTVPPGSRLRRTKDGLVIEKIENINEEEVTFNAAIDAATLAGKSRRNVADAIKIIEDNDYTRVLDGLFIKWLAPGKFFGDLVPTQVSNLHAAIKSLNSQVALGALARLKSLSPNGASGLGAVNQREWSALEQSILSLDANTLTASQLYKNLKRIDEQFKSIIDKVVNDPNKERGARGLELLKSSGLMDEYFETSGSSSSQASATGPSIDLELDFGGPKG